MSLSDFRGRGRGGFRGSRGRGGPPRGGGFRGGYSDRSERGGFRGRGRGDGYTRGGPPRRLSRDDLSPPRKAPLLSKSYDSRRSDHYDDEYSDRAVLPRSRDTYSSQIPRERLNSRDRNYAPRGSSGRYPSGRGDYSPMRESGSYRDSYNDRKESYRSSGRDYPSSRSSDYRGERLPRDSPRDYTSSRDYLPPSREFRETLRDDFRDLPPRDRYHDNDPSPPHRSSYMDRRDREDSPYREDSRRDYSSRSFSSRMSERPPRDYPPSREYRGRGGPRGGIRGGRDFFANGRGSRGGPYRGRGGPPRGRGGPPRGRGARPDFYPREGGRRSSLSPPPSSRDGPLGKRPRLSPDESYSRR